MISKLSWILFIPLTLAAIFFKLAQTVLPDNAIFGWSDQTLDYVVIGCVALVFLFALIMCLCDRKISKYYLPHRNYPAGIIGLLIALVMAADGADSFYGVISADKIDVLGIIEAVMLIFAAIVFVVMGLSHSFLNKSKKTFGLLYVAPALLCAVRLIRCFVEFTTISLTYADVTRLFCYIFATMFFFNYAVTLSLTQAKNAVKSCFIYGFPAAAAMLSYAIGTISSNFYNDIIVYNSNIDKNLTGGAHATVNFEFIMHNAQSIEIFFMGLYILAFLIELSIFVKDKDHVIVEDEDDVDYKKLDEDSVSDDEGFVVTGVDDEDRAETPASSYISTADTSDFLYQEIHNEAKRESSYYKAAEHDVKDYLTDETASEYDQKGKEKTYADQLDEIDKLILEISGDK